MENELQNGPVTTLPAPEETTPPPAPESTTPEGEQTGLDPEAVKSFLKDHPEVTHDQVKDWDHDTWKKVPAYNANLKRAMDQRDAQARAQQADLQVKAQHWQEWENARVNDRDRFDRNIQNPQAAAYYAQLQGWAQEQMRGGAGFEAQLVDRWTNNAKSQLAEHPDLAPIVETWDQLQQESEGDPGTFLRRLIETGVAQEKRRLKAAADAEVDARVNAALNRRNAGLDEPVSPPGSVVTGPNAGSAREVFKSQSSSLAQKKAAWGEMYPGVPWPGPL